MLTELSMFERMQMLPLFMGLSQDDISEVVAHTRLDFQQLEPGQRITKQGDPMSHTYFVMSGTIRTEYKDDARELVIHEWLEAPYVIEPWNMYGINQQFERSYIAETPCSMFGIDKRSFKKNLTQFSIIATNHINMVTNRMNRQRQIIARDVPDSIAEKIMLLVLSNSIEPEQKRKRVFVAMNSLARLVGETRLNVSRTLHKLEEQNIINVAYKGFEIPDFNLFTSLYNKKQ